MPCSSKPSFRPSAGSTSAWQIHLSWGSSPLQRSTVLGARMPRRFHPPAPSVLRVFHPLDVLLHPKPCGLPLGSPPRPFDRNECTPTHAPGVPPDLRRSPLTFRSRQGDDARVPSPRLSPPPRRTRFRGLSSLALRVSVATPCSREPLGDRGRHRVSIAEESVFPKGATLGHRPS